MNYLNFPISIRKFYFLAISLIFIYGCDCPTGPDNFFQINLETREVTCLDGTTDCFQSVPFNLSIIQHINPQLQRASPADPRVNEAYASNFEDLDPLHSALDIYTFKNGDIGSTATIHCDEPPGRGGGRAASRIIASNPNHPTNIFFIDGQEYSPTQPPGPPVQFLSISFFEIDFNSVKDTYKRQLKNQLAGITILDNSTNPPGTFTPNQLILNGPNLCPGIKCFTVRSPAAGHRMIIAETVNPNFVVRINMRDRPNAEELLKKYVQILKE